MADLTGTSGADTLTGTNEADMLASSGTSSGAEWDTMIGLDGADTYALYATTGGTIRNFVIDDRGRDGADDQILYAGAMFQSASLGYQGWAQAEHLGDDLVIHLPGRPYRFHHPGSPEFNIRIVDHYADAAVETIEAGGVLYYLAAGDRGSRRDDIIAGTDRGDALIGAGGSDFLFGNEGQDTLRLGAGNDVGFGGAGRDRLNAGAGDDIAFGGDGADTMRGGRGQDRLNGEAGDDAIFGGGGFDNLSGGAGNDRLVGNRGNDRIDGGLGNDKMIGGAGNDLYVVAHRPGSPGGHDVIVERGTAGSWAMHDTIEVGGIYGMSGGSVAGAMAALSFARVGKDMVMEVGGGAETSVTVRNMLDAARHDTFFVEALTIAGGYWTPIQFRFLDGAITDIGDDRTIFLTYGAKLNEVLFGTNADDQIFGGTGINFVWTGDGADTLIYKVGDGQSLGDMGGTSSHDIVMDFDPLQDRFDFTEVANDIGAGFSALVISNDARGDATIFLNTGNWEVADIFIELRGVSASEVDASMFLF